MKLIDPPSLLILYLVWIQACFPARYLLIKLRNDKISGEYNGYNKANLNKEKVGFKVFPKCGDIEVN